MIRTVAAAAALGALMAWWAWLNAAGGVGFTGLDTDPSAFEGRTVVVTLATVTELRDDGFRVEKGTVALEVVAPHPEVAVGADVSVGGIFRLDPRRLEAEWVEVAERRAGKKGLGLLALAFLAVMAPMSFRVHGGRVHLRG